MKLINALGFNGIWLGCIFYGDKFLPIAMLLLLAHFMVVNNKIQESYLVFKVALIGVIIDSLFAAVGVFDFSTFKSLPQQTVNFLAIPAWLIILWLAFAATLNHSLSFLKHYLAARYLTGLVAIPLSYLSGYHFNAVYFNYSVLTTFVILALTWSLFMVLIFPRLIKQKLPRFSQLSRVRK